MHSETDVAIRYGVRPMFARIINKLQRSAREALEKTTPAGLIKRLATIALGCAILTFGMHNIHQVVGITEGGVFVGVGAGLVVRCNASAGGDDALALSIHKVTGLKLARCYLFTDLSVLLLSLSYIPITKIVFSLVTVFISSPLIDFVVGLGANDAKGEEEDGYVVA